MVADEVAGHLGICVTSVHDACNRGELPEMWIGRRRFIPTGPLRRLLGIDVEPQNETTPELVGPGVVVPIDRRQVHEVGFDGAG